MLFYGLAGRQQVGGASEWFNNLWPVVWPTSSVVVGHFLMIGTEQDIQLNPVIWTLAHEMRISLLFPLLVVVCRRDTRLAVVTALVLLVASTKALAMATQNHHPAHAESLFVSLLWTLQMIPYFITGILLSKHREQIHLIWTHLPSLGRFGLLAVTIIAFAVRHEYGLVGRNALYDIGAAALVVLAIEGPRLRAFLTKPVPQWLGRISYSLYLIHLPVMLIVVPKLIGRMPFILVVVAVGVTSLASASLMHILMEMPAIKLGHRLTRRAPLQSFSTGTITTTPIEP
jgi:peptidoglycan/LPS O-acetylase OafA/YrhL